MAAHELAWTAPQPFWTDPAGSVQDGLDRPRILRFATDDFMQELLAELERDPTGLADRAVFRETWRGPAGVAPQPASDWLEREPRRIGDSRRTAKQRARGAGALAPRAASHTAAVLKLYQPAHLRHYLVSGSLVCRKPGLPDRAIDPARHKVSFVVRRLFPRQPPATDAQLPVPPDDLAGWDEYAFALQGKAGAWRKVVDAAHPGADRLVTGEERQAMFPASFAQDDGHPRRLYVGNVPVGKREAYQGAAQATVAADGSTGAPAGMDPRLALFHTRVLAPWKALVNRAMRVTRRALPAGTPEPPEPFTSAELIDARPDYLFVENSSHEITDRGHIDDNGAKALRKARASLQTASWYLVLDLADFLAQQFDSGFLDERPSDPALAALFDALEGCAFPAALTNDGDDVIDDNVKASLVDPNTTFPAAKVRTNLRVALNDVERFRDALEGAAGSFEFFSRQEVDDGAQPPGGWPDFLFLFADPWFGAVMPPEPAGFAPASGDYIVEKVQARIDALAALVEDALPGLDPGAPQPEPALATMQPADMREAWYALRLVYERPECAPFETSVVSRPTQPFQMAGFFDPDAPARPVRIGLPLDISPAGLRKFDKNTAFMLSDMLCGQMDRMKGIGLGDLVRSVLPWPLHKDLDVPEKGPCTTGGTPSVSLGVMCSLSIPIVTICALILLLIIASILDSIFRWMPYLIACFPLPKFKAK